MNTETTRTPVYTVSGTVDLTPVELGANGETAARITARALSLAHKGQLFTVSELGQPLCHFRRGVCKNVRGE